MTLQIVGVKSLKMHVYWTVFDRIIVQYILSLYIMLQQNRSEGILCSQIQRLRERSGTVSFLMPSPCGKPGAKPIWLIEFSIKSDSAEFIAVVCASRCPRWVLSICNLESSNELAWEVDWKDNYDGAVM
jgi:hypothetical protein